MRHARLLLLLPLLTLSAFLLSACQSQPRPHYSTTTPSAKIHANTQHLADSFASRLSRLRPAVLQTLPHASPTSTYAFHILDSNTYATIRHSSHALGQIQKHPFRNYSRITLPEEASDAVLIHELVHAHRSTFWQPLTRFMEEGLAEFISEQLVPSSTLCADAIVYLGFSRLLSRAPQHTLSFRYPTGGHFAEFRGNLVSVPPAPNFDPFRALAAPSDIFDDPAERRALPCAYAAATIIMRRAILPSNNTAPFAALASLCERARSTRAGILDVDDVFRLAGFPDVASFDQFIAKNFDQAWLDTTFNSKYILELILQLEAEYEQPFDSPDELFETTDLRYLLGNFVFSVPEDRTHDHPTFRAHLTREWPTAQDLDRARTQALVTQP